MQHDANSELQAVERLIQSRRAGWASLPMGGFVGRPMIPPEAGSVLVERATGCLILSSNGQAIARRERIQFPRAIRFNIGRFRAHAETFEGVSPYMYLDCEGLVTVGIGHQISDVQMAMAMKFYDRGTTNGANAVHIRNAYNKVLNSGKACELFTVFKQMTHVDLDLNEMERIFNDDVNRTVREIVHTPPFTEFETYPAMVQLGILDLAFNMGTSKFAKLFKQFGAALKFRNWAKVAMESRRTEVDRTTGNLLLNVQNRNNVVQGWFFWPSMMSHSS